MDLETQHISVLSSELIELLNLSQKQTLLDCTFGGGGHTKSFLTKFNDLKVFSADRDKLVLKNVEKIKSEFGSRFTFINSRFSELKNNVGDVKFDAVVADLGVSTDQIKGKRGFSFVDDSSLDMRMDEGDELTASYIVNNYEKKELFKVLKVGGVGQEANAMVEVIFRNRPFGSAKELSDCIYGKIVSKNREKRVNPSTVLFQALRIEVNKEFLEINSLLDSIPHLVSPTARIGIISFHSLEDKEVVRRMRKWEQNETYPSSWPGNFGNNSKSTSLGKLLTKKAVFPNEDEILSNPSSRSARLRIFEFNL